MRYIAVEGNIGAGKTTLAKIICERFNARFMPEEFEDNPFLPNFYEDSDRYALQVELSFLADRYRQMKRYFSNEDLFQQMIISDYIIDKCLIFAAKNLKNEELKLYTEMYNIVKATAKKPDLIIHLHRPVNVLLENILKRGREYESRITGDYLKALEKRYAQHYKQNHSQVLIVDSDNKNFEEHPHLLDKLWPYLEGRLIENQSYLSL